MATVTLTTGVSVPLLGAVNIVATTIDPTATRVTLQWDITQHLAGNSAALTAECDISLDGGLTWNFLVGAGRDQGYAPDVASKTPGLASISHPLLGVGSATRMVRATLTSTAQVTTSMQLVIS